MNKAINNQLNFTVNAPIENRSLTSLKVLAKKVVSTLSIWKIRSQQRHDLLALNDHMLKDIGITRIDAKFEARKPFWQA